MHYMTDKPSHNPEVQLLPTEEFLRKHQEMYFGSGGANPRTIASAIAEGALLLGATAIQIQEKNGWWYVCANMDWLEISTAKGMTSETIFNKTWAFPERCANCVRAEIMARVFSAATFTVKANTVFRVSGELPPNPEIIQQISFLGNWERVLAFKFQSA
jgi:hypothetical protein